MPKGRSTASMCIRMNLDNEQHLRVYEVLDTLDKRVYKSRNSFVITALDEYIKRLQNGGSYKEEIRKVNDREDEAFRQEIRDMIRDEVLHMLGSVIAGKESVSGNNGQQTVTQEREEENEREKVKVSEEALSIVAQWSQ